MNELYKMLLYCNKNKELLDLGKKISIGFNATNIYCDEFIFDSFPFDDNVQSLEKLEPKPLDINTQISNIKRQLKYEKNPLVIKNLNRKMNKLIKEKKYDSRRNEK